MQYGGKLETCHFRGPFFINKKVSIEQLLQNNHNHGSGPKDFNKNIEISWSGPPKHTFVQHKPQVNSVRFLNPYDHINTMESNNDSTHLSNSYEKHIIDKYEKENAFYDVVENTIIEE